MDTKKKEVIGNHANGGGDWRPGKEPERVNVFRTIVELIGATKTKTGLAVQCAYDTNWYQTGQKISDGDFKSIPPQPHHWPSDWNYTITAA